MLFKFKKILKKNMEASLELVHVIDVISNEIQIELLEKNMVTKPLKIYPHIIQKLD